MLLKFGLNGVESSLSMSLLMSDHFKTMNSQLIRLTCQFVPLQMISRLSESSPLGPMIRWLAYVGLKRLSNECPGLLAFPPTGTQGNDRSAMERRLTRLVAAPTSIPSTLKPGGTRNIALSNIDFSTHWIWAMLFLLEKSSVSCLRTPAASFIIFVRGGGVGWC